MGYSLWKLSNFRHSEEKVILHGGKRENKPKQEFSSLNPNRMFFIWNIDCFPTAI